MEEHIRLENAHDLERRAARAQVGKSPVPLGAPASAELTTASTSNIAIRSGNVSSQLETTAIVSPCARSRARASCAPGIRLERDRLDERLDELVDAELRVGRREEDRDAAAAEIAERLLVGSRGVVLGLCTEGVPHPALAPARLRTPQGPPGAREPGRRGARAFRTRRS